MDAPEIPPMKPLAPLVDRMRALAQTELPSPRTGRVELWNDGTFGVVLYHSMGNARVNACATPR